jgi:hypothetical protein
MPLEANNDARGPAFQLGAPWVVTATGTGNAAADSAIVFVILSHSGGLLLINLFAQQLRQLGDVRRNPPRAYSLALGELSHLSTVDSE